jgi:hypothetical protein
MKAQWNKQEQIKFLKSNVGHPCVCACVFFMYERLRVPYCQPAPLECVVWYLLCRCFCDTSSCWMKDLLRFTNERACTVHGSIMWQHFFIQEKGRQKTTRISVNMYTVCSCDSHFSNTLAYVENAGVWKGIFLKCCRSRYTTYFVFHFKCAL